MTTTPKPPFDVEPLPSRISQLPSAADQRIGRRMLVWLAMAAAALTLIVLLVTGALAADAFCRPGSKDIAARLTWLATDTRDQTITFADAPLGALPKDFVSALTGQGKPGRWDVVEDKTTDGGKALAQLDPDRTDYRFPLAIFEPTASANVEVTVRFKAVSGQVDQAGGVVVRLIDPNNYYLARANALEDNVNFYRVVGGKRQEIAGAKVKVTAGEWHALTLRARGTEFAVLFDGKQALTAKDERFGAPGKVAVWTKADSITHFDRIVIKALQ